MFKQFLEPIQGYEDMSFSGSAQNIVLNKIFLVQIIIITFIYLLVLFIVQNFKNFYCGSTVMRMRMVLLPKTIFFGKIINIILIYLLAPFIVQNFKEIIPVDPEFWECAIFGPKMAHLPK